MTHQECQRKRKRCPRLYVQYRKSDNRAPTGVGRENIYETGGFFKSDERNPLFRIDGLKVGDRARLYRTTSFRSALECKGTLVQEKRVDKIDSNARGAFRFKVTTPLPYTTVTLREMHDGRMMQSDKRDPNSLGHDSYFVTRVTKEGTEICAKNRHSMINYQLIRSGTALAGGHKYNPENPNFAPNYPPSLAMMHSGGTSATGDLIKSSHPNPTILVRNIPKGATVTIYANAGCRGKVVHTEKVTISKGAGGARVYYKLSNLVPNRHYTFSAKVTGVSMRKPCSSTRRDLNYMYTP